MIQKQIVNENGDCIGVYDDVSGSIDELTAQLNELSTKAEQLKQDLQRFTVNQVLIHHNESKSEIERVAKDIKKIQDVVKFKPKDMARCRT